MNSFRTEPNNKDVCDSVHNVACLPTQAYKHYKPPNILTRKALRIKVMYIKTRLEKRCTPTFLQATPEYRLVEVPKTRSLRMDA